MEIYIYVLILAGYLVLWLASGGCGGKGIGRIAKFLYERGRTRGRSFSGSALFREGVVRRDLAILFPYGRLEGEERRFYTGRIRIALLILLAGDILAIAGYAAAEGNMLLQGGGLVREEVGGEDRSTELKAYIVQEKAGSGDEGGGQPGAMAKDNGESSRIYQGEYHLEVRSQKLSRQQAGIMAERVFALLPGRILGENESLGHVTKPLDLPGSIEGYPFRIFWESSSYALIDSDGTVGNRGMREGEKRKVALTAILSYDNGAAGELKYEKEFPVTVYGAELSEEDRVSLQIREAIRSADAGSVSEERLPMPDKIENLALYWEEKPPGSGLSILVFAGIAALLTAAAAGSRLHEKVVRRERQMAMDYPQIISKFVLYLGAGLSVRSTFVKLGQEYSKLREEGLEERGAYEEILLVCRELAGGIPETEAYANFGKRCRSRQYTRLSAVLAQNLKKGNQELLSVMQQEARASFEERKNTARKLGEEAETKLLLPMIMMLAITMLIIIIPAYYSFAA